MKAFEGIVISTHMTSTVVVEVFRVKPHPLYKKLIRLSKKYKADTAGITDINLGSVVRITEIKPVSKDKYFKVSKVISKGDGILEVNKEESVGKVLEKPAKKAISKTAAKKVKKADTKALTDKKEKK